jgi:hypothetical protein
MLTKEQVSWKNEANARAWCELKGYGFLSFGAFDVYYRTPEQVGVMCKTAMGFSLPKDSWYEAYSKINWLDVFADLFTAGIDLVSRK